MTDGGHRRGRGRVGAVTATIALVVLALVLVGGAWWVLSRQPTRLPEGTTEARVRLGVGESQPATSPPGAAPVESDAGRARRRARVDPASGAPVADSPPGDPENNEEWHVLDESGALVLDPDVRVLDAAGQDVGLGVAAPAGRFVLPPEARSSWGLRVTHDGYRPLVAARAEHPDRRLVLRGTGRVTGRVVDDAGRGVAGAEVVATPAPTGIFEVGGETRTWRVTTDGDGRFVVEELPPRPVHLRAEVAARAGSRPRAAEENIDVPGATDVVLRLGPWPVVTGRVLDAAGAPIEGADVAMRARAPNGRGGRVWTANTDARGVFSFDEAVAANTLWAWSVGHPDLAMAVLHDVEPGGSPLEIRLAPGGPLEARVVDATGAAYTHGATFYVLDATGRLHNSANFQSGRVRTHVLPFDASFDLLVQGSDGTFGRLDDVRAGSRGLVVQMRPVRPIVGQVRLPDGSPAPEGIIVRAVAVRTASRTRAGIAVETQTQAGGRFRLANVADLPFSVWAESDDARRPYGPSVSAREVRPGDDVTLALRPGVRLAGRFEGVGGRRTIHLVPEGDRLWSVMESTSEDGTFDVRSLVPGVYSAWVRVPPEGVVSYGTVRAPAEDVVLRRAER